MKNLLPVIIFFISMFFCFEKVEAKTKLSYPNPPDGNGKVIGIVIDSINRLPIEFATISVFPQGSTKPVDGTVTDSKGAFRIQGLSTGTYRINITFIGYRAKNRTIVIDQGSNTINMGNVTLSSSYVALKGVTVTSQRDIIENRIDKMVFNAEKDITSQVGAATDVLRKVPQVSVDVNGNVELRGSQDVKVLINGKPSTILATSLADALQSIPANQIKSIEVITSPSAKYEAEGTGGIINIILKKSTAKGIQGNINTSVGTRFENGTFNISARKGTFGVNAGISGNMVLPTVSYTTATKTTFDTIRSSSVTSDSGSGKVKRHGYNSNFGFDWDISEKDNLSSTIRYNNFGFSSDGPNHRTMTGFSKTFLTYGNHRNIAQQNMSLFAVHGYDWNTDYKRVFNDRGRELDLSYQFSQNNNQNNYSISQNDYSSGIAFSGRQGNNLGKSLEQNIKVDYTEPISKTTKLELGSKVTLRNISSSSVVDTLNLLKTNQYDPNAQLDDNFGYVQKIYAAYALITFKPASWVDVYGGLRIEHTDNQPNFAGLTGKTAKSYNSYIPSLTLSHTISQSSTIKISYTERIQRPGLRDLDPFINALDPLSISQGNPDLGPEHSQLAEIGYNTFLGKGTSINISLYYRYNTEDIQPYTILDSSSSNGKTYNHFFYTKPLNIGIEHISGINLFGSVPVTPKFTLRGNVNLYYQNITSNQGSTQTNNSFNYRLNLNASYNFTETLSGEFFGFLNSPRHTLQGTNPSFSIYNFGLRKQLWKKKGSIAITASSPFQQYLNFNSSITGPANPAGNPSFISTSNRKFPIRQFGINFSYAFGKINYKGKPKSSNNKPGDNDGSQGGDDSGLGGIGGGGGGGGGAPSGGSGRGGAPSGGAGRPAAGGKPGQSKGTSNMPQNGFKHGQYPGAGKRDSISKKDSSLKKDSISRKGTILKSDSPLKTDSTLKYDRNLKRDSSTQKAFPIQHSDSSILKPSSIQHSDSSLNNKDIKAPKGLNAPNAIPDTIKGHKSSSIKNETIAPERVKVSSAALTDTMSLTKELGFRVKASKTDHASRGLASKMQSI